MAFKTGVESTGWSIKNIFKITFTHLYNTPARGVDFVSLTGQDKFSLCFFLIRWIEDKRVSDRLIEISRSILQRT